ncbi:MAG: CPBP family intramembrane glutamic endopeptidase [Rickettsiaceae bacterium]|nr:CPBP family intramembrane glutamic endopeptidase [Rickettsiaceae bacterium]
MLILSYFCIALSAFVSIFSKKTPLILSLILMSLVFGFLGSVIDEVGILSLVVFYVLCSLYFDDTRSSFVRLISAILGAVLLTLLCFHKIPGFDNYFLGNFKFSDSSYALSLYLNYDKISAAMVLIATSGLYKEEKFPSVKSLLTSSKYLLYCVSIILVPAYSFGYIDFDPKFPEISLFWVLNNLIFVAFAEEVIFRGVLQNQLKSITSYDMHIYISALIFGILHFHGGLFYVSLSVIAGIFYGFAYDRTHQRLTSSIFVHFWVNGLHFFLFSYPFLINFR